VLDKLNVFMVEWNSTMKQILGNRDSLSLSKEMDETAEERSHTMTSSSTRNDADAERAYELLIEVVDSLDNDEAADAYDLVAEVVEAVATSTHVKELNNLVEQAYSVGTFEAIEDLYTAVCSS
jgi:hypothetical protein